MYGLPDPEAARLHVVPHGSYAGAYPDLESREAARARLQLPAAARVLLFLGAVRGYKGTQELATAFAAVGDADARLVIAGKPREPAVEATLREAAAADPRILLRLGYVPDEEVGGVLRAADAVVLPFRDILTSGSAILAMTYGLPVVAPALGCLPETVPPDGGILYEPDAPDALADAIRASLTADLVTMGAAAAARAAELDWGPIAERTAELYRGDAPGG
jgi:glycosyltransferase involved in cell wall biosynthesis